MMYKGVLAHATLSLSLHRQGGGESSFVRFSEIIAWRAVFRVEICDLQ